MESFVLMQLYPLALSPLKQYALVMCIHSETKLFTFLTLSQSSNDDGKEDWEQLALFGRANLSHTTGNEGKQVGLLSNFPL